MKMPRHRHLILGNQRSRRIKRCHRCLARAIEAFQLETKDLGMVLDAVTKTAQDTGQSTEVLFDRVTKGAPTLKDLNLDFAPKRCPHGQPWSRPGWIAVRPLSYLSRAQVNFAKDGRI